MAEITTEMLAGRPMTKRMRLYRKDGSDYWANLSFQPIRDRLGTFSQWVCVERDISDIVEREEMRSDLMAMIGHDLRNPLQSILGFSELLLEDLAPQAAEYDAVRQIRISARRLESLAAEMLIVSLLERDEYRPQLEIVELGKLLEDVLSYFSERERIDLSAPVKIEIMVDSSGIRHVVENLLSNAVKFSTPASRVAVTVTSLEGAAVISVRDSGIGIPAEDLPTIFERAKRGSNVGKRKGTGLGLSFAKHLVELNGGTIQVASTEGLGTTFEVFFRPLTAA
jgi:signal transduction histidine kinase